MKRLKSCKHCPEPDPLPLEIILTINQFVVEVGVVSTENLLSWYSVNKDLYRFWSEPEHFLELMSKSGEKALELFGKTRHGFYHTIYKNHFLYRQIFPMVATLHERIINHIHLDRNALHNDIDVYKSFPDAKGKFLRYEDLVPVALEKQSARLFQILSSYMCYKFGWLVEIHHRMEQIGFTMKNCELICLRPVEKLYTKDTTK